MTAPQAIAAVGGLTLAIAVYHLTRPGAARAALLDALDWAVDVALGATGAFLMIGAAVGVTAIGGAIAALLTDYPFGFALFCAALLLGAIVGAAIFYPIAWVAAALARRVAR